MKKNLVQLDNPFYSNKILIDRKNLGPSLFVINMDLFPSISIQKGDQILV